MKRMLIFFSILAIVLVALPACGTTMKIAGGAAQTALEPYAVEANAKIDSSDGGPGLFVANSKFIAIDGRVEGTVRVWGLDETTGERAVLKTLTFEKESGRRVYQLVFTGDKKVVKLVPSTWELARLSIPNLPE